MEDRKQLEPTVPASEHQRVQAEAAALLKELANIGYAKRFDRERFDDDTAFADWAQSRASYTHDHASDAGRALLAEMEKLRAEAAAARKDALSSSAGAALLEEMEGLRRERDELRAIPSGLFDALEATTTALEAAGLRSDLTSLARAVMRGEPEVLRAYRAESADLRARLERAERARQDTSMGKPKPVDWMLSAGRVHLVVAGTVVTTEGDLCRDESVRATAREADPNHWRAWEGDAIRSVVENAQEAIAAEVRRAVEEAETKTKAECADIADGRVTRDEPANALNDWQRGYSRGRQDAASAIRAQAQG